MNDEVETPRQRTDIERLLSASIEIIQKDQIIDDLLTQVERLKAENALLTARLDVVALQRMRQVEERADLPALLRTQV